MLTERVCQKSRRSCCERVTVAIATAEGRNARDRLFRRNPEGTGLCGASSLFWRLEQPNRTRPSQAAASRKGAVAPARIQSEVPFAELAGVFLGEYASSQVVANSALRFGCEFAEFPRGRALEFNRPCHPRPLRRSPWNFCRRATAPNGPRRGRCPRGRPYCLPRSVAGRTPCYGR